MIEKKGRVTRLVEQILKKAEGESFKNKRHYIK